MLKQYGPEVTALEPIRDQEQDDLDFLYMLAIAYGQLKRSSDSARICEQLVRVGGDTPHMHLLMGKVYLDTYQNAKAEDELVSAVAGDPTMPFAHYDLGVLYQRLGQFHKAAAEFEKEMQISPDEPWSYESRGNLWIDAGNADRAIPLFQKALKLNAQMPDSLAGLAKAYFRLGHTGEATTYLKRAIELEPDNAKFHYQLGRAFLKGGQRAEAQKEFALQQKYQSQAREKQAEQLSGKLPPPVGPAP
jgi:Flp pilus assembly protein TadD